MVLFDALGFEIELAPGQEYQVIGQVSGGGYDNDDLIALFARRYRRVRGPFDLFKFRDGCSAEFHH